MLNWLTLPLELRPSIRAKRVLTMELWIWSCNNTHVTKTHIAVTQYITLYLSMAVLRWLNHQAHVCACVHVCVCLGVLMVPLPA